MYAPCRPVTREETTVVYTARDLFHVYNDFFFLSKKKKQFMSVQMHHCLFCIRCLMSLGSLTYLSLEATLHKLPPPANENKRKQNPIQHQHVHM